MIIAIIVIYYHYQLLQRAVIKALLIVECLICIILIQNRFLFSVDRTEDIKMKPLLCINHSSRKILYIERIFMAATCRCCCHNNCGINSMSLSMPQLFTYQVFIITTVTNRHYSIIFCVINSLNNFFIIGIGDASYCGVVVNVLASRSEISTGTTGVHFQVETIKIS